MNTTKPFSLIDEETGTLVQDMMIILKTGQSVHLNVNFDTTFKLDLHSEIVRGQLVISYLEHQENVRFILFRLFQAIQKKNKMIIYFDFQGLCELNK